MLKRQQYIVWYDDAGTPLRFGRQKRLPGESLFATLDSIVKEHYLGPIREQLNNATVLMNVLTHNPRRLGIITAIDG